MRHLVLAIATLGIACATPAPVVARPTAAPAPEPTASAPGVQTRKTAVEAAAEYALTTYVDESTRAHGVVCVELDRAKDPATVLARLGSLATRVSADRNDCRSEPSAILSIGPPQIAGDRARVDVGVVLGSAGMLELERHQGDWQVVRATSPWISLR
jgi:hypothetical protein